MTKYINLFHRKNQSVIVSSGIKKTKNITLRAIIVLLSIVASMYGIQLWFTQETAKLEEKKRVYNSFVQNNTKREKEIVMMDQRKKAIEKYLENDISFLPYYTSLREFLQNSQSEATPSSVILGITFSENRNSKLSFFSQDYESHISLIKQLESEPSKDLFERVAVNGAVYVNTENNTNPGYVLNTEVTFTNLEDETL